MSCYQRLGDQYTLRAWVGPDLFDTPIACHRTSARHACFQTLPGGIAQQGLAKLSYGCCFIADGTLSPECACSIAASSDLSDLDTVNASLHVRGALSEDAYICYRPMPACIAVLAGDEVGAGGSLASALHGAATTSVRITSIVCRGELFSRRQA